jgi:teichuronic acid biosynthesis glycosyltransferase TuaC
VGIVLRIRGLLFAKQYPSSAEPMRGTFVARQVSATSDVVDWRVIAPVPWAPRPLGAVLRRPQPPANERVDGVRVGHPRYLAGPRRMGYRRTAAAMARASASAWREALVDGVDLVHAHGLYPSGCAAVHLVAGGVPLVLTLHGSDLYAQLTDPGLVATMAVAARAAARVVCVSTSLARDAASVLGLDRAAIRVIPDAYDDNRFEFVQRREHAGPVRLVCVGRLEKVKGHDVLIEALAELARGGRDVHLTVVGDGRERDRLQRLARERSVQALVGFAGALSGDALLAELQRADLYVQPSRREGFGVAVVEAMATGLPVVATRSGGPEDILTTADGVLVAPDDAIALAEGLAETIDRIDEFDEASIAARVSGRYSRAIVGAALDAMYRDIAAPGADG